jgi:hypothetical protein
VRSEEKSRQVDSRVTLIITFRLPDYIDGIEFKFMGPDELT